MSEKFVASNRVEISRSGKGVYDHESRRSISMSEGEVDALREFFRHERDEELGRWRDPMDPSYFVIKNEYDRVVVVNERSSRWTEVTPKIVADYPDVMVEHQVGARYFAAHPVSKPWHGAKQNEIWVLTIDGCGEPEAYRFSQDTTCVDSAAFRPVNNPRRTFFDANAPTISGARRIFPEASNA